MTYDVFVPLVLMLSCILLGLVVCLFVLFNQVRMLRNSTEIAIALLGKSIDLNAGSVEERFKLMRKDTLSNLNNSLKSIIEIMDEQHEICREALRAASHRHDELEKIQSLQTKDIGFLFNKTRNLKAVRVKK